MSGSDLAPALLVAMPQLVDPNFRRAVVLLLHHDEEGTFGLVVNRLTDVPVDSLCSSLEIGWHGPPEEIVHWGGPVQPDHGWVLLGADDLDHEDVQPVTDGIAFTSSPDALRLIAEDPPERLRVFLGYAGWGPGQLANELAHGSWIVAPVTSRFVFDVGEADLWEAVLQSLGINPATLVPTQGVN